MTGDKEEQILLEDTLFREAQSAPPAVNPENPFPDEVRSIVEATQTDHLSFSVTQLPRYDLGALGQTDEERAFEAAKAAAHYNDIPVTTTYNYDGEPIVTEEFRHSLVEWRDNAPDAKTYYD